MLLMVMYRFSVVRGPVLLSTRQGRPGGGWLGCRSWKLGDETDGDGQFVELKMGLEEDDCVVAAGLTGYIEDVHTTLAEWVGGFDVLGCVVVKEDVVGEPGVEILLYVLLGHEAADLIAHDDLEIVGEA